MSNKQFNIGPFNIQIEKKEKPKEEFHPITPQRAREIFNIPEQEQIDPEDAIEEEQPVEQKRTLEEWLYSNKIKIAAGLSAIFFIGTMCGYILTSSILDSAYQEHLQHKIQTSIGRK